MATPPSTPAQVGAPSRAADEQRPAVTISFRAEPGVDLMGATKALLKRARRSHGLVCVGIVEEAGDA